MKTTKQMNTIKLHIKKGILFTLVFVSHSIYAQQTAMYTHYMYNTLVVNPGYAGSRDALTVTALFRSQWVDFSGAPMTQTLTMHTPIKNSPLGFGLSVMNDKIGPVNNTSFVGSMAYKLKLSESAKLAFGLSAGMNVLQAHLSSLQLDQQSDPTFQNNIRNHTTPNLGAGIYYSRERFYAGLSVPNLIENKLSSQNNVNGTQLIGKEQRHYFFVAGAVFNIANNLAFKPTTLIKVTSAAPIQMDLTASFIIRQTVSIGAMYRTGDALGILLGLDLSNQLHVGYSYDWSHGIRTFTYNQGSHEFLLRYDFLTLSSRQIHSPRYF